MANPVSYRIVAYDINVVAHLKPQRLFSISKEHGDERIEQWLGPGARASAATSRGAEDELGEEEDEDLDVASGEEDADAGDCEAEDSDADDARHAAKRSRIRSPTPLASSSADLAAKQPQSASPSPTRASRKLDVDADAGGRHANSAAAGAGAGERPLTDLFDGLNFDLRSLRSLSAEERSKLRRNIIAAGGRVLDDQPSASATLTRLPSRTRSGSPMASPDARNDAGRASTQVLVVTESTRQQSALSRAHDDSAAFSGGSSPSPASSRLVPLEWVCSSLLQRRRLPLLDNSRASNLDIPDL